MLSSLRSLIRDPISRKIGEPHIDVAIERLDRQGFTPDLIFDIGAYVGEYAEVCRKVWPTARVACFEPLDEALSRRSPA